MIQLGNDWDKILADEFKKKFGYDKNDKIIIESRMI